MPTPFQRSQIIRAKNSRLTIAAEDPNVYYRGRTARDGVHEFDRSDGSVVRAYLSGNAQPFVGEALVYIPPKNEQGLGLVIGRSVPEEETRIASIPALENIAIAFTEQLTGAAPECDTPRWRFDGCQCSKVCDADAPYNTSAECSADNIITANWITVRSEAIPATDGSCRYEPNGGYLFCDEVASEKFPGYQTASLPQRTINEVFSAVGWYSNSPAAEAAFDVGWSEAERIANGWTRTAPAAPANWTSTNGRIWAIRQSADGCDSIPAVPSIPGSFSFEGSTFTLFTTTGSSGVNSSLVNPYTTAQEPRDAVRPTKNASIVESNIPLRLSLLHQPKAKSKINIVDMNSLERYRVYAVAQKRSVFTILKTGLHDPATNEYERIRIFENQTLISDSLYPNLPTLEEKILALWTAELINYSAAEIVSNPCGQAILDDLSIRAFANFLPSKSKQYVALFQSLTLFGLKGFSQTLEINITPRTATVEGGVCQVSPDPSFVYTFNNFDREGTAVPRLIAISFFR